MLQSIRKVTTQQDITRPDYPNEPVWNAVLIITAVGTAFVLGALLIYFRNSL